MSNFDPQRPLARFAGGAFLLFIVLSSVHYATIELGILPVNPVEQSAEFIRQHNTWFRAGIVIDLALFITGSVLAVALFVLLQPFGRVVALLGLSWLLLETTLSVIIELSSFVAVRALEMKPLLSLVLETRAAGYGLVVVFFNLGFIAFSYLLLESRRLPRLLAIAGMGAFGLMLLLSLVKIIFPSFPEGFAQASSVFVMLFQLFAGCWLLFGRPVAKT